MYISHTFYPSIVNDELILFDFQMTWNKTCYEKHVYLIVYIFILIFCSINISLLHHFYNIMLSLFELYMTHITLHPVIKCVIDYSHAIIWSFICGVSNYDKKWWLLNAFLTICLWDFSLYRFEWSSLNKSVCGFTFL